MESEPDEKCAAPCGLFCGACPNYPERCLGCLSDFVEESCRGCPYFRILDCTKDHGVTRCYECGEFPCARMKNFTRFPIINGGFHHGKAIEDSERMREVGVEQWLREKTEEHTCPKCGARMIWFNIEKHECGKK